MFEVRCCCYQYGVAVAVACAMRRRMRGEELIRVKGKGAKGGIDISRLFILHYSIVSFSYPFNALKTLHNFVPRSSVF